MTKDERYEKYNEITFEAYCKAAIDNAVARCRKQIARQAQNEVYFDDLPEYRTATLNPEIEAIENGAVSVTFHIDNISIDIHDPNLANALRFLPPQKKEILLLSYFTGRTDEQIGEKLKMSGRTVRRKRGAALEWMRLFLGDTE